MSQNNSFIANQKSWILFLFVIIFGVFIVYFAKMLIFPFLFALILTYLLGSIVDHIEVITRNRIVAVLIVYLFFISLVCIFFLWLTPILIREIVALSKNIPLFYPKFESLTLNFKLWIEHKYPFIQHLALFDKIQEYGQNFFLGKIDNLPNIVFSVFTLVSDFFFTLIILFFFLLDGHEIKKQLFEFVPNRYFEKILNLIYKIDMQIGNYLRGLIIDIIIVGSLATIALLFLNVNYAFLLGTFIGICNLIPYFGPIIALSTTVLIYFFQIKSINAIFIIVPIIGFIHFCDGSFIQPFIYGKSVNLHPVVILVAILIGGAYGGVIGMIIAIPTAAVLKVIIKEITEAIFSKVSQTIELEHYLENLT
ncbi:MAG: AI-2E family transporter [Candidatus Margulisiibacteriota bacterium]|jgi:predicted PurR-regulated permease PerM